MKYEIAVNNLRGYTCQRFAQMIIECEDEIPEPKDLTLKDIIINPFKIYQGNIVKLLHGPQYEELELPEEHIADFKYRDVVREINEQKNANTSRLSGYFTDPEKGELWKLSREYGELTVVVLVATKDYFIVKVVKPNRSRLEKDAELYIFTQDIRHFHEKIK